MKCERIESALLAVIDGRATAGERRLVAIHTAACAACARRLEEMRAAWSALEKLPPIEPSAGFDARLRARIAGQPRPAGWLSWFPAHLRAVAAIAVLAVLAVWLSLRPTIYRPAPTEVQSQEDFAVVKNLPVLEDYDVVSSLDALSALPGAQTGSTESPQPMD